MATVLSFLVPAREGGSLLKSQGLAPFGKGGIAPWRKPPWQGAVDLDRLVEADLRCRGDMHGDHDDNGHSMRGDTGKGRLVGVGINDAGRESALHG